MYVSKHNDVMFALLTLNAMKHVVLSSEIIFIKFDLRQFIRA